MKWVTKDIDMYLQAREYVDTAIIPLVPLSWSNDLKTTVVMGEFISIMANEIERQFKGRLVLFPPFTYRKLDSIDLHFERLSLWAAELTENGMKHIFYLTSDSDWKQVESQMGQTLVWLPTIPLEHVDEQYKRSLINDQMNQLMPIFINEWKEK